MVDNKRMERIKNHKFTQLNRLISTEEFADLIGTNEIALIKRIQRNPYGFPEKVKVEGQSTGMFLLSDVNKWIENLPAKKYKYKD